MHRRFSIIGGARARSAPPKSTPMDLELLGLFEKSLLWVCSVALIMAGNKQSNHQMNMNSSTSNAKIFVSFKDLCFIFVIQHDTEFSIIQKFITDERGVRNYIARLCGRGPGAI